MKNKNINFNSQFPSLFFYALNSILIVITDSEKNLDIQRYDSMGFWWKMIQEKKINEIKGESLSVWII